jgi:hypothetical protein
MKEIDCVSRAIIEFEEAGGNVQLLQSSACLLEMWVEAVKEGKLEATEDKVREALITACDKRNASRLTRPVKSLLN